MGGAPARRRSPAARGAPPADGACAVSAAAAPRHRPRGTGEPRPLRAAVCSGRSDSSRGPLPSRLGDRAPSESPGASPSLSGRPHVASAPWPPAPRPPPPGSGECLAAVASGSPPRPPVSFSALRGSPLSPRAGFPASSRPPQPLVSVLSAVPRAPWSVPFPSTPGPHSACSRDGQPLPLSSLVASFVCRLPPARPLWDLGQHHSSPWPPPGLQGPEGVRSSRVPLGKCGTSEAFP